MANHEIAYYEGKEENGSRIRGLMENVLPSSSKGEWYQSDFNPSPSKVPGEKHPDCRSSEGLGPILVLVDG